VAPVEERGGGKIFLAFSSDNPLKTLDSTERKKAIKRTKRKEKKPKPPFTDLSQPFTAHGRIAGVAIRGAAH
jgi:hypothetical protein